MPLKLHCLIHFSGWENSHFLFIGPFLLLTQEDLWNRVRPFPGREARCRSLPELRPRGVVGGQRQDGGGTLLRPPRLRLLRMQGTVTVSAD